MRQLRNLLVGVLLAGFASGAFATTYAWSFNLMEATIPYLWTTSAECGSVAKAFSDSVGEVYARLSAPGSVTVISAYSGGCSGSSLSIGSTRAFVLHRYFPATATQDTVDVIGTLMEVAEPQFSVDDDFQGVPLQRVFVLVGCSLMFGLGWIGGKA